jgi:hypothetical protein
MSSVFPIPQWQRQWLILMSRREERQPPAHVTIASPRRQNKASETKAEDGALNLQLFAAEKRRSDNFHPGILLLPA